MIVTFEYKIGKNQQTQTIEVDEDEWDELTLNEKVETLKDEVADRIKINAETIKEK